MFKKKERLASIVFVPLLYLFLLTGLDAYAQKLPPSRDELKAAYCIVFLKKRVHEMESFAVGADDAEVKNFFTLQMNNANTDYERVKTFFFGRMKYLDDNSLKAALTRAIEDSHLYYRDLKSCDTDCGNDGKCLKACVEGSAAGLRMATCQDLSFLPF